MKLLSVLALLATGIGFDEIEALPGAEQFEDWLAVQYSRFAPEPWIQAYTQISEETRKCLMGRLGNLFGMYWNSQPIDIQQHLAQTKEECSQGFDKVQDLLNIILSDHNKQTPLVQSIFSQFIGELAANGRKGFRKASVNYQANWLKAQPIDQQTMAGVFPKLKFFFDGPYSIPLTQQALAVAQCKYAEIPAFLVTIARIHLLAEKTNPAPPQGPYASLHEAVHEDFAALRQYAATNFPDAEQVLKNLFSSKTLYQLTCTD